MYEAVLRYVYVRSENTNVAFDMHNVDLMNAIKTDVTNHFGPLFSGSDGVLENEFTCHITAGIKQSKYGGDISHVTNLARNLGISFESAKVLMSGDMDTGFREANIKKVVFSDRGVWNRFINTYVPKELSTNNKVHAAMLGTIEKLVQYIDGFITLPDTLDFNRLKAQIESMSGQVHTALLNSAADMDNLNQVFTMALANNTNLNIHKVEDLIQAYLNDNRLERAVEKLCMSLGPLVGNLSNSTNTVMGPVAYQVNVGGHTFKYPNLRNAAANVRLRPVAIKDATRAAMKVHLRENQYNEFIVYLEELYKIKFMEDPDLDRKSVV